MNNNDIYWFFDKIKNQLSSEQCYLLDDVYNRIVEVDVLNEQLENEVEVLGEYIESTYKKLENIVKHTESDKIHSQLSRLYDESFVDAYDVIYNEQKSKSGNAEENDVLKMVKRGFKFNTGYAKNIYEQHMKAQNKLTQIENLKQYEKQFQQKLSEGLKQFNIQPQVKLIDNKTIQMIAYSVIDVKVDLSTLRIKGKGVRKYKDDIEAIARFYISLLNEHKNVS